jgi:hypothetical protein
MRTFLLVALAILFGASGDDRSSPAQKPLPETQPTTRPDGKKPEKVKSVDDEIKELNLKTMNLGSGMSQFDKLQLDVKLKGWCSSTAPDFAEARKHGVQIAGIAKNIDWKRHRKRTKDPAAFDKFSSDLESAGRKIAEAAGKKDAAELQTASSSALKACSDCHGKFNQ